MTPYVPEPNPHQTTQAPREPGLEESRENALLGLALFGAFVLLFAGTVGVALVYLALD